MHNQGAHFKRQIHDHVQQWLDPESPIHRRNFTVADDNEIGRSRNWQEWLVFVKNCMRIGIRLKIHWAIAKKHRFLIHIRKLLEDAFSSRLLPIAKRPLTWHAKDFLEDLAASHVFDRRASHLQAQTPLAGKARFPFFREGLKIFDGIVNAATKQAKNTRI